MSGNNGTPAFTRARLAALTLGAALVTIIATAPRVAAQAPDLGLIRPSTPLDTALSQIALYYHQSIGFEQITSDPVFGGGFVDLTTMTVDEALTEVIGRAARPYHWRRADQVVFVRPHGDGDASSWLNQPPRAMGLGSERRIERQDPARQPMSNYATLSGAQDFRVINQLSVQPLVPNFFDLTLGESWLELQRPNHSWRPFVPKLRDQEMPWREYPETSRRITVRPGTTVWDTIAALMVAHGGVSMWTLAHPALAAVAGQTNLQVVSGSGWSPTYAGIPPVIDIDSIIDPTGELAAKAFQGAVSMLPSASSR